MEIRYVYRGKTIGSGYMTILPRTGDFINYQALDTIFRIEAIMFVVGSNGDTGAIIRLVDVMPSTDDKLRKY